MKYYFLTIDGAKMDTPRKCAHIGTETSAEELARTLLQEEKFADVVTITEQENGKIASEIYKIYSK